MLEQFFFILATEILLMHQHASYFASKHGGSRNKKAVKAAAYCGMKVGEVRQAFLRNPNGDNAEKQLTMIRNDAQRWFNHYQFWEKCQAHKNGYARQIYGKVIKICNQCLIDLGKTLQGTVGVKSAKATLHALVQNHVGCQGMYEHECTISSGCETTAQLNQVSGGEVCAAATAAGNALAARVKGMLVVKYQKLVESANSYTVNEHFQSKVRLQIKLDNPIYVYQLRITLTLTTGTTGTLWGGYFITDKHMEQCDLWTWLSMQHCLTRLHLQAGVHTSLLDDMTAAELNHGGATTQQVQAAVANNSSPASTAFRHLAQQVATQTTTPQEQPAAAKKRKVAYDLYISIRPYHAWTRVQQQTGQPTKEDTKLKILQSSLPNILMIRHSLSWWNTGSMTVISVGTSAASHEVPSSIWLMHSHTTTPVLAQMKMPPSTCGHGYQTKLPKS